MVSKSFIRYLEPFLFPVKLYELAHSKEIKSINWSPDGSAVQLDVGKIGKECFETGIFNVIDYRHVFRQLSYYGFQRTWKKDRICEFSHPLFHAQRLDLVKKLKRSGKKNRNLDIASLKPFIERRTSSRLQGIKNCNPNYLSVSKHLEAETDSESSDDYEITATPKHRRRKIARKRTLLKKFCIAEDKDDVPINLLQHAGTTRQSTAENGNSLERSVNKRGVRNKNKRTRKKRKCLRFRKKGPSRHATEDIPVQRNDKIHLEGVASTSYFSAEKDVERNSNENLKNSPIKISIKRLYNSYNCSTSIDDDIKTIRSVSVNSNCPSISKLRCVQRINYAKNTEVVGSSRVSTPEYTLSNSIKIDNNSNTLLDKPGRFFHTTADNDCIGANPSPDENGDFKFSPVPVRGSKNFVLGKNYKWMSVKEDIIDSTLKPVKPEAISSTSQSISIYQELSTSSQNQETSYSTIESQPILYQNDCISTQSSKSIVASPCHLDRREKICTNPKTSVVAVNINNCSTSVDDNNNWFWKNPHQSLLKKRRETIASHSSHSSVAVNVKNSSTSVDDNNNWFWKNPHQSLLKKRRQTIASHSSHSSSKLRLIQSDIIPTSEGQISQQEINDIDSNIVETVYDDKGTESIKSENDVFFPDFENQSFTTRASARTSSDNLISDVFSPDIQRSVSKLSNNSLSQRGCSKTKQTKGKSDHLTHAVESNNTFSVDNVEEKINISPTKREELVQYLYLQVKTGKINSWDLLESSDPIIRNCAYDVLTLDVEKARGQEIDFVADNKYDPYDGMLSFLRF